MDDEEQQADLARLAEELKEDHDREAFRKTAEIMEKLDLQKLNAGINKTVNPTSLEAAHNLRYTMPEKYSQGFSDPRVMMTAQSKPN